MTERRRKTDSDDDITAQIMTAISQTTDPNMRAVLLIIHSGFGQLSAKIDAVLQDENTIKNIVLNGHSTYFHDDMTWLHEFRKTRHAEGKCPYVVRKELEDAEAAKSRRTISERLIERVIWGVAVVLTALLSAGALKTFAP
jgi:hypothetical protein